VAHDGSGTGWDEAAPADSDQISSGAQEIRDLRKALRIRLEAEHENMAVSSGGGEHLEGSAKVYRQAAAPTTRPDGTALDGDDDGRLWCDSDTEMLYIWSGAAFTEIQVDTANLIADCITGAEIADDAIDSEHYVDGSIDRVHLAADIIDGTLIEDDAVDTEHIADDAVDSDQIVAGAIDAAHLSDAIGASLIKVGTYTGTGAASNDVTTTFTPTYVRITRAGYKESWTAYAAETDVLHRDWQNGSISGGDDENGGISWAADGFGLEVDASFNESGETYYYMALAG